MENINFIRKENIELSSIVIAEEISKCIVVFILTFKSGVI